jgi:hypothetical protein
MRPVLWVEGDVGSEEFESFSCRYAGGLPDEVDARFVAPEDKVGSIMSLYLGLGVKTVGGI